jgi:nitrite reductase/ring-hydroxylating ferredoxin subunit
MDFSNTKLADHRRPARAGDTITVGRVEDVTPGSCVTVDLSDGRELALHNVNGEFHATSNFCPHKGAPLAMGRLTGHVIECDWHGWQFDVRTGECLTVNEPIEVYEVFVEDGLIKIRLSDVGL